MSADFSLSYIPDPLPVPELTEMELKMLQEAMEKHQRAWEESIRQRFRMTFGECHPPKTYPPKQRFGGWKVVRDDMV